jgi:hypothetical protein
MLMLVLMIMMMRMMMMMTMMLSKIKLLMNMTDFDGVTIPLFDSNTYILKNGDNGVTE